MNFFIKGLFQWEIINFPKLRSITFQNVDGKCQVVLKNQQPETK